jgi:hypothetical protein
VSELLKLWPPIEEIEAALTHTPPLAEIDSEADLLSEDTAEAANSSMPDFIADAIRRRVAANQLPASAPAAGLIIALDAIRQPDGREVRRLTRRVAFVLDAPAEAPNVWRGWLAGPETDYATLSDLLLQPEDEPFDPLAGIIQAWNTTQAWLPNEVEPLCRLSAERLADVRFLAAEADRPAYIGKPTPGRMLLRITPDGRQLLTGSPLGSSDDPRWAYRALYRNLAAELLGVSVNAASGSATPASTSKPAMRQTAGTGWYARFARPQLAMAAMAMLAISAVANMVLLQQREQLNEDYAQFRSAGGPAKKIPALEVRFREQASEKDIRALLLDVRGEFVGGPGQLGIYRIGLAEGNVEEAERILRASPLVESVQVPEKSR